MAQRSDTELVAFSHDRLLPEIHQFFAAGRELSGLRLNLRPALPWLHETALLESFALHARALIDFFFIPRAKWKNDALARHFFAPQDDWEQRRPDPGPWLELVRGPRLDRVGAEIAHLRYDDAETLDAQARGWPIMQLAGGIGGVVRVFVEDVPPSRVSPSFRESAWREIPAFVRVGSDGVAAPLWPKHAARTRSPLLGGSGA